MGVLPCMWISTNKYNIIYIISTSFSRGKMIRKYEAFKWMHYSMSNDVCRIPHEWWCRWQSRVSEANEWHVIISMQNRWEIRLTRVKYVAQIDMIKTLLSVKNYKRTLSLKKFDKESRSCTMTKISILFYRQNSWSLMQKKVFFLFGLFL